MADAQATFVATLDTSGIQAGAKAGLTAMQRLGMEIQKRSKELAAMKASQDRLAKSAGVQEYLKRQKAIERNEAYAAKVEKRLAAAQENLDIARQANVAGEDMAKLEEEARRAAEAVESVKEELADLESKQAVLAKNDASVAAYRDQAKVIKETESQLAELQAQYSAAGGSASDLATEIKEPRRGLLQLADTAKQAGGPLGALGNVLEMIADPKVLAKAGAAGLVLVLLAIAAAAATATARLARFAIASADIARNAARARSSAAFGSLAGTKEIEGAMSALRENTAASKEEAQALASELYRLGDRADRLAETAVTIERFGQLGDDAKQAVKGLYEELRKPTPAVGIAGGVAKSMVVTKDMLPRDVFLELANQLGKDGNRALLQGFTADKDQIRQALARIGEQRFAGPALEEMRSLDKLAERVKENLEGLFEQLKIGVLLGALQKLVAILDESSASGKALRQVLAAFAQPFVNAVEGALPYLTAFVKGVILGGLIVALVAIKMRNAFAGIIPDSFTKNIDWLKVTFFGAAAAVLLFTSLVGSLAVSMFILALPVLLVVAALALLVIGVIMAIDAIVGWFDSLEGEFEALDFEAVALDIINGLINGLTGGAGALLTTFKDLAKSGLDAFKTALGIKSPSLAFRLAGRDISRGAALGVEDEAPAVQSAAASMVSPDDMGAPGAGKRRGGGVTFIVQPGAVVIQGVKDAEALEDDGFVRKLARALISAAAEGGVTPEPEPA